MNTKHNPKLIALGSALILLGGCVSEPQSHLVTAPPPPPPTTSATTVVTPTVGVATAPQPPAVIVTPAQPVVAQAGTSCQFTMEVAGDAGATTTDVVTVSAADDEQNPISDSDDATVTFTDDASTLLVEKTANVGSVPEPGGPVCPNSVVPLG